MAVYLDHNATTPIAPEVAEAMWPFLTEHFGNPSSSNPQGRLARRAIDEAREQLCPFPRKRVQPENVTHPSCGNSGGLGDRLGATGNRGDDDPGPAHLLKSL